ncbi:MAG: hypothetical protein NTV00_15970 [Methylococcales bacterium]|nr:hypothetical protein [Methylococcales bacterium]
MYYQITIKAAVLFLYQMLFFTLFMGNSHYCVAQQNLFNVPSAEITQQKQVFIQQQFNVLSTTTSNTTIDYGLGDNWEIGINLFNVDLYSLHDEWANPLFLLNFQKAFELTPQWRIGIGSQSGPTLPIVNSKAQLASFNYVNNAFDLGGWGKYYLGVYYANQGYAGEGSNVSLMAGIEVPTPIDTVFVMADYIGGKNALNTAVIGVVWKATVQWQLSLGALIATPESDSSENGVVVEITRI